MAAALAILAAALLTVIVFPVGWQGLLRGSPMITGILAARDALLAAAAAVPAGVCSAPPAPAVKSAGNCPAMPSLAHPPSRAPDPGRGRAGRAVRPCRDVKVFPGGMRIGETPLASSASVPGRSGMTITWGCCLSPRARANGYREYSLRDAVGLARDSPPPSTRTSARPRPPRSAAPST